MMKKSTAGFSLIELVVGILCTTLVTGAAMSLMLMGLRNAQSLSDAHTNLENSRIILTMVENLASEGAIQKFEIEDLSNPDSEGKRDWALMDSSTPANVVLRYSHARQTIYTTGDVVLMEGVTESSVSITNAPLGGSLIDFSITSDDGQFETTAYCRHTKFDTEFVVPGTSNSGLIFTAPDFSNPDEEAPEKIESSMIFDGTITGGRTALLSTLLTQYGSRGQILDGSGEYFSSWYNPNWTHASTAWCACFVSWGIDFVYKSGAISPYLKNPPCFAHVQTGWDNWDTAKRFSRSEYVPVPGDLIFFEWGNGNGILDHIGVVLYVGNGYVYAIEGNSNAQAISDGWVAIQRYPLNSDYIHGYGVLDWINE